MTSAPGERTHDEIAELFPDYILGALPPSDMRRVADHLGGCERCRLELDGALQTASALFDAGPVNPAIRRALVARLSPGEVTAPWPVASDVLADRMPAPSGQAVPVSVGGGSRSTPIFGRATRTAAAVAAALVLALAGWAISLQRELGDDRRVDSLVSTPSFAHFLTDTEAGSTTRGVIYVDPDDDQALVTARGLAPVPAGYGYQVWLFTETGEQASAGFLPVDALGDGHALVTAPEAFEAFWAVGLSAEPLSGSASPTAPLALGGWIR